MTPWLDALHNSGLGSEPVLFISAFVGATSALADRTRSRLGDGLYDLLKAGLIPGRPQIDLFRKSLPSCFEENAGIFHRTDRTVIPIRAPPIESR
jgi:hypothetical protein